MTNMNRQCKSTEAELKESSKLVAKLRRQRGTLDKALSKQTRLIDNEVRHFIHWIFHLFAYCNLMGETVFTENEHDQARGGVQSLADKSRKYRGPV